MGGERAGKSFISAEDLTSRIPFGQEYWLVGPDYYLPRAEFEYILENLTILGAIRSKKDISTPKEGSWELKTKSGQVIKTRTNADVRKLASLPVDGALMCEAGQQDFATWLKMIGRVSETRGFVLASGTFETSFGWYADTFREYWPEDEDYDAQHPPEGRSYSIPTWDNHFIFPGGRNDPEILRMEKLYASIPGYFEEKCGAKPAPPLGVIFRRFSHRRNVSEVAELNTTMPVYLAVDPAHGGASAYAIAACQFFPDPEAERGDDPPDFCHVIDAMYVPGGDFAIMNRLIREKFWFPYVRGGAIDVEAPDERRRWRSILGVPLVSKKVPILAGERRLQTFVDGHLFIHPTVTAAALREFSLYRSGVSTSEDMEKRTSTAAKSRYGPDHFLKALWYLLYIKYGPVKYPKLRKTYTRKTWRTIRDAFR